MNHPIFNTFFQVGMIPVLVFDSTKDAAPTAQALAEGDLPIAEVTLRTPAALESITLIKQSCPEILVGAGTVINPTQASQAVEAGAQFLVSPGLSPEIIHWAQAHKIPVLCGAITPTEIMLGINLGLKVFKFFPSAAMGGLKTMKALADPFPGIQFIPTGGINQDNFKEHLQEEVIFAVGGSWVAKRSMIQQKQFNLIKRLARDTSSVVSQIRTNSRYNKD